MSDVERRVVSIDVLHRPLVEIDTKGDRLLESTGGPVFAGRAVGRALKRLCFPVPRAGETVAAGGGMWPDV
jgi:hypothetical protein